MKLTIFFLTVGFLHVAARGVSQTITFSGSNTPLKEIFRVIKDQTGFVVFSDESYIAAASPVTVHAVNTPLDRFLSEVLQGQGLSFSIKNKTVFISRRSGGGNVSQPLGADTADPKPQAISGTVTDSLGRPLAGASVQLKGTRQGTVTGPDGRFELKDGGERRVLVISFTGYVPREIRVNGEKPIVVSLVPARSELDQVQIIGYGTTTRRLNTGAVTTVTAETLAQQPVSNPLAALEGRVPGMVVSQTSGLPGGAFNVQVRGRTSLDQTITSDQPLFIIDGVPFAAPNNFINQMQSALGTPGIDPNLNHPGGASPFNSINPQDIESIEVLKDADATAIYGSRGANGVVLITTKKGNIGKTKLNLNVYTGMSRVTRLPKMMNTRQYVAMRREAFANDGVTPDNDNAFDLLVYDTTRYTDFAKLLIGNMAQTTDAQASVSGGSVNTQFVLGGSFHHESTVFPGNLGDNRGTMHANLSHASEDRRLKINFSALYSSDKNNLIGTDLTSNLALPPDLKLYNADGTLAWNEGGVVYYDNPLEYLNQKYTAQTDNLLSNLQIGYTVFKKLTLRVSGGYNTIALDENSAYPSTAQNPAYSPYLYAEFATNRFKSYLVEPQAEFNTAIGKGKLDILVGGTWQDQQTTGSDIEGNGYSSDALLGGLSGASNIVATRTYSDYRYNAGFGRINYNWNNQLLINLSGRRDGSSRFGPANRLANFGAVGVAWIFSNTGLFREQWRWLSFGKLRASYGTTGNDKIPDYQYLDTWTTTTATYEDSSTYTPGKLFNPNFRWERTRKLEVGMELGFLNDRIMLTADYYRNRSSNQLIQYTLPYATGFTSVIENFPALVQNEGLEFTLGFSAVKRRQLSWNTVVTLTMPRNELVSFPGLSTSSYKYSFIVGKPLNAIYRYQYLGIDPASGHYQLNDVNHDGKMTAAGDYVYNGSLDPAYYGGLLNSVHFHGFQLDVFFEFRKQIAYNYLNSLSTQPGTLGNLPAAMLDNWKMPGDKKDNPVFSQAFAALPFNQLGNLVTSSNSGVYGDASFVRMKNVALSCHLPAAWLAKCRMSSGRIYVQGQNLLTLTSYQGSDPETHDFLRLPPLRTFIMGVQFNF
ncbi:MAG TPA: SusC/RagA family TonB-linked outer membrane protein [Puia sp.]|nr:SusC/RagA family TonB-linked outer membrane protein [Puia sp.]